MTKTRASIAAFAVLILACAAALCGDAEKPAPKAEDIPTAKKTEGPAFPVKSEWFEQITESTAENPTAGMEIERFSMLDIVAAIRASSPQHLASNIDPKADFKEVFLHPDKNRGHVVTFDGTFQNREGTIKDTDAEGKEVVLYEGQISHNRNIVTFVSLEPIPENIKAGSTVRFVGIFMKRFTYLNRAKPGNSVTHTPLVVIRKLEAFAEPKGESMSTEMFIAYIVIGIFIVVIFMRILSRHRRRSKVKIFTESTSPFAKKEAPKGPFRKSGGDTK